MLTVGIIRVTNVTAISTPCVLTSVTLVIKMAVILVTVVEVVPLHLAII